MFVWLQRRWRTRAVAARTGPRSTRRRRRTRRACPSPTPASTSRSCRFASPPPPLLSTIFHDSVFYLSIPIVHRYFLSCMSFVYYFSCNSQLLFLLVNSVFCLLNILSYIVYIFRLYLLFGWFIFDSLPSVRSPFFFFFVRYFVTPVSQSLMYRPSVT